MLVAVIVYFFGVAWINALLPPAAMGAVVALIGLELAGTAAKMGGIVLEDGASVDVNRVAVFIITLMAAVLGSIVLRGFLALIPVLLAIIIGYLAAAIVGLVDLTPVKEAAWFSLPAFSHPTFDWGP